MPNDSFQIGPRELAAFSGILRNLSNVLQPTTSSPIKYLLTIGSHPTSRPPPIPSPFRISTGRFPQRAMTGYALTFPDDERCVLSAYSTNAKGTPFCGSAD